MHTAHTANTHINLTNTTNTQMSKMSLESDNSRLQQQLADAKRQKALLESVLINEGGRT